MTRTFFVFEKSYTCISQGKRVANCPIFLSHQAAFSLYKCVTDRVYDTIQHAARPRFQWHLSLHFAWPIFGDSDIREIWPQVWSSVSTRSTSFALNIKTQLPQPRVFQTGPDGVCIELIAGKTTTRKSIVCKMASNEIIVLRNFINGQFSDTVKYLDSENPATGQVFVKVPDSDASDVDQAVNAAKHAFKS